MTEAFKALSLIIVTHAPELALLRLQALALALYADPDLIQSVTVILNSPNPQKLAARIEKDVRADYGPLGCKVLIKPWPDLWLGPFPKARIGWRSQQALKLLGAAEAPSETVLILDSKTLPIRPMTHDRLFAPDGRLHMHLEPLNLQFRDSFDKAADITGLDETVTQSILVGSMILPPAPPFLLLKADAIAAIDALTRHSGSPFPQAFMATRRLTEFYLLAAQILASEGGIEGRYALTKPRVAGFFAGTFAPDYVADQYDRLADPEVWALNLHRTYVERCSGPERARLTDSLKGFGLLDRDESLRDFYPRPAAAERLRNAGRRLYGWLKKTIADQHQAPKPPDQTRNDQKE